MSRATAAYARVVLLAGGADVAAGTVAHLARLPGLPACLAGGILGLVAACAPWREAWLRLQVAWLRTRPGLVYLKACYSDREPVAEAPAPKRLVRTEAGCDCRNCRDLKDWSDRLSTCDRHGLRPLAVIGGKEYRTVEDLRDLPNPPVGPASGPWKDRA